MEEHEAGLSELDRVRKRVHHLADVVQRHEGQLIEFRVLIDANTAAHAHLASTAVSRESLELALTNLAERIKNVHDDLRPLKSVIYWAARIIVGAVIIALVTLVLKK